MDDADGIVLNRKLTLCPSTEDWPVADLIKQCPNCEDFLLYCCGCNNRNRNLPKRKQPTEPCHHYRIIFTDGACMNNGQAAAKAGVGAAYGTREETQLSEPITNVFENLMPRSNQRAELWAARLGLQFMAEALVDSKSEAWILATDSEYVVKGMTEWLPTWKRNGYRTAKGTTPVNLDLFLALDSVMAVHEANGVKIGLWHIPREHNTLADRLAKAAAVHGDEGVV